jgi:DNA polymerase I-like protein with 3'-5' exonuclease and polymerase domains
MTAPATSLAELLARTRGSGAAFRLHGHAVQVLRPSRLPPNLHADLKARRDELWDHLGGAALDQPSLDLLATLGVQIVVPNTVEEAIAWVAEIEADSDVHTPAELHCRPGLIGLDIETAALPGMEHRPPIKLRKNGLPAKHQPALSGDAGLDPYRARIRLVQLYGGGQRCLVLDTDIVPVEVLTGVLQRRTVVIHNASFELRFLTAASIQLPQFEDTMQAAGLLLGTHRRSLDDAAVEYLGIALPKGLQRSDWSAPHLSPGQLAYAAIDAIVAFRLWLKLRVELLNKNRGGAYLLQRDVTPAVARMTARGILLDRSIHADLVTQWSDMLAKTREAFVRMTGQQPPDTPNQVRAYLDQALPEPLRSQWPRTQNGLLSIRAAELRRVAHLPAIQPLLSIASLEKLLSAFGTDLATKISAKSGRLHPSYNIAAAKTGRFSSNHPNVQQLPKRSALEFRDCITAAPGSVLVVGDFNMMELRAAAAISGDPVMTADFANGIDLHRQQAAAMLGIAYDDVTSEARDRAKPVNFSMIYGAGAAGLVATAWNNYGVTLSLVEAEHARQSFLQRYATYANWMRVNHVLCTQRGAIVIGQLGRVIEAAWEARTIKTGGHVPWHQDQDEEEDSSTDLDSENGTAFFFGSGWAPDALKYTLCCNAPVQGGCADCGMLALTMVDAALRTADVDGGPVLFVHDEIVVEVASHQVGQAREILTSSMMQAFAETFPGAPLTGVVSIGIGESWGSAKP